MNTVPMTSDEASEEWPKITTMGNEIPASNEILSLEEMGVVVSALLAKRHEITSAGYEWVPLYPNTNKYYVERLVIQADGVDQPRFQIDVMRSGNVLHKTIDIRIYKDNRYLCRWFGLELWYKINGKYLKAAVDELYRPARLQHKPKMRSGFEKVLDELNINSKEQTNG